MAELSYEATYGWMSMYCGSRDLQGAISLYNSLDIPTKARILAELDDDKSDWLLEQYSCYKAFVKIQEAKDNE